MLIVLMMFIQLCCIVGVPHNVVGESHRVNRSLQSLCKESSLQGGWTSRPSSETAASEWIGSCKAYNSTRDCFTLPPPCAAARTLGNFPFFSGYINACNLHDKECDAS